MDDRSTIIPSSSSYHLNLVHRDGYHLDPVAFQHPLSYNPFLRSTRL
jgi:hypothetical protein